MDQFLKEELGYDEGRHVFVFRITFEGVVNFLSGYLSGEGRVEDGQEKITKRPVLSRDKKGNGTRNMSGKKGGLSEVKSDMLNDRA